MIHKFNSSVLCMNLSTLNNIKKILLKYLYVHIFVKITYQTHRYIFLDIHYSYPDLLYAEKKYFL